LFVCCFEGWWTSRKKKQTLNDDRMSLHGKDKKKS
jgi:hypothetical protein